MGTAIGRYKQLIAINAVQLIHNMKPEAPKRSTHYFVDESGDGVLFGTQGRLLLGQPEGRSHFMLGALQV